MKIIPKKSGSSWLYYRNQKDLDHNDNTIDFPVNNDTILSFKYKQKLLAGQEMMAKNTEIWAPLKYWSIFWKSLEMQLINCEINLMLTWSEDCIIIPGGINDQVTTFPIIDAKLYVSVVTLSTQKNV